VAIGPCYRGASEVREGGVLVRHTGAAAAGCAPEVNFTVAGGAVAALAIGDGDCAVTGAPPPVLIGLVSSFPPY